MSPPRPLPDGMASTSITWPATDAHSMHLALEAAARSAKHDGDSRTLDQLRTDALAAMAQNALVTGRIGQAPAHRQAESPFGPIKPASPNTGESSAPGPGPGKPGPITVESGSDLGKPWPDCSGPAAVSAAPGSIFGLAANVDCSQDPIDCPGGFAEVEQFILGAVGGAPAQIRITMPLSVLMGLSDSGAELEGYGPIPADVARAHAAGGVWKRMVTDPVTNRPVERSPMTYTPPAWLREQILAQIPYCVAPTCNTSSRHADLDHGIPFPQGPTEAWNLHPLCRHHHVLKTHSDLDYSAPETGTYRWTTPAGHTYLVEGGKTIHIPATEDPDPPPF